ncbi:MAG: ATP-binding protein [Bacillota bacterium]
MIAIYGANASGKTSLVLALEILRTIVLIGNIRPAKENRLLFMMDVCPFIHDYKKYSLPVKFEITFIIDNAEFVYGFEYQAALVADAATSTRRIVGEYLIIDETEIYRRDAGKVVIAKNAKAVKFYEEKFDKNLLSSLEKQINKNLDVTDLFLTNAFKSVVNSVLAQKVIGWFTNNLLSIGDVDEAVFGLELSENTPKGQYRVQNAIISALLAHADFGPQDVSFVIEKDENAKQEAALKSEYHVVGSPGERLVVPAEWIESKGTLKVLKLAIPFISALEKGYCLVVDELDSSLHPDLMAGIIRVFNNPEINTKGAQLIFTTHNPVLLNKNLFRKDQIVFVSKDKETFESEVYSLADFKTYGENAVRGDEVYLKNYINGKYGALPSVDFESAVLEALSKSRAQEV